NNELFSLTFKINDKERFYNDVNSNKLFFIFNDYTSLSKRLHGNLNVYVVNAEAKTIQISFKSNNSSLSSDLVSSLIISDRHLSYISLSINS
ncbi:hypothetical protein MJH12_12085, partial [bacterium]|nr:hypothetical protein [bacterium]